MSSRGALDGRIASTSLAVDQVFLAFALGYILLPVLMVVLALVLPPRANRISNLLASTAYAVSIVLLCIGETWVYYLMGSAVEVGLLLAITVTAWRWTPSRAAAAS